MSSPRMNHDPALDTLLLPFATEAIAWPEQGDVLFLRARAGSALLALPHTRWLCEQTFKPHADQLRASGYRVGVASYAPFPLVLALPTRQRDETRALLARAMQRAAVGGIVVASMANSEGARSGEADLERLAGSVQSLSKSKCRVFWATASQEAKQSACVEAWAGLDAPRPIADGSMLSRPGLFAWDRIDIASALLAQHLPNDLAGHAADLGAGSGYLSMQLLARNPHITALDVYEAESRALDLARVNLASACRHVEINYHWHDVGAGLLARYDAIVSNPPFHQGRADQPDLGQAFIAAAARALNPGGRLWLVANRHLPYEAVLSEHFASVRTPVTADGFKVIEAVKAIAK